MELVRENQREIQLYKVKLVLMIRKKLFKQICTPFLVNSFQLVEYKFLLDFLKKNIVSFACLRYFFLCLLSYIR